MKGSDVTKSIPWVASDGAHATEENGHSNNQQAHNTTSPTAVSCFECAVEYLGNCIASCVICRVKQRCWIHHHKRKPQNITPTHDNGDDDGAQNAIRTILVRGFRLFRLPNEQKQRSTALVWAKQQSDYFDRWDFVNFSSSFPSWNKHLWFQDFFGIMDGHTIEISGRSIASSMLWSKAMKMAVYEGLFIVQRWLWLTKTINHNYVFHIHRVLCEFLWLMLLGLVV